MTSSPRHRQHDGAPPEAIATLNATLERIARNTLAERIFETAVAYKEAVEDKSNGKWVESERWADYMGALHAHAIYVTNEFKKNQAKEETC